MLHGENMIHMTTEAKNSAFLLLMTGFTSGLWAISVQSGLSKMAPLITNVPSPLCLSLNHLDFKPINWLLDYPAHLFVHFCWQLLSSILKTKLVLALTSSTPGVIHAVRWQSPKTGGNVYIPYLLRLPFKTHKYIRPSYLTTYTTRAKSYLPKMQCRNMTHWT